MKSRQVIVAVVFHGRAGAIPFDGALPVVTYVNADHESRTAWRGFGANHNRLMSMNNEYRWYVAMNPDVNCQSSDILRLISEADAAGYSIASPLIETPWGVSGGPRRDVPSAGEWVRETIRGSRSLVEPLGSQPIVPSAWVSGACIAIRLAPGIQFDERYFMYFEDVDLCDRAWRRGLKVGVCTSVVVSHKSGWRLDDPLLWRRGVEFARSAVAFAATQGASPSLLRWSGTLRFGSRRFVPCRTPPEKAASLAIARGFLKLRTDSGLAELAQEYNRRLG